MALLDLNKKAAKDLPIQPRKDDKGNWLHNGLSPVQLTAVEVTEQTNKEGEFAGIVQNILKFHFESCEAATEPKRYLTHVEKIIGTLQGDAMEERTTEDIQRNIEDMWARIKHILDGCRLSPNYRNISSITKKDYEKYFDLPAVGTPEARIAKFNAFFTYIAAFINGDGDKVPSMLIGDKGNTLVTGWLKLVPNHPSKKWYVIPTWVQTGFFEPARVLNATAMTMPKAKVIEVKPSENIELSKATAATPGAIPGAAGDISNNPDVMNFLNQG